jgi:hypothetical protein
VASDLRIRVSNNGIVIDEIESYGTIVPEPSILGDVNLHGLDDGLDVDPVVAAVVGSTHQIPEPSTLLLLTLIALGVVGGWRKWKRAA